MRSVVILVVIVVLFSSCKREYKCECWFYSGSTRTVVYSGKINGMSQQNAENECRGAIQHVVAGYETCELVD